MPVQSTTQDILSHIDAGSHMKQAGAAPSLQDKTGAISGRITVASFAGCSLVVSYSVSTDLLKIAAELDTPLGTVQLGSATIDPNNPSVTLSGGAFGFKAEVTFTFDFNSLVLTIAYKVCAPFAGCQQGSTSVTL